MLAGIHNALEADGGFEIVGETLDGTDVLAIVERTRPDLVLLDVRMPKMDGLDVPGRGGQALPRDQGRDAVGLDLTGADRRRAAPRSERVPREERRPDRPPLDAASGARGQRLAQNSVAGEDVESGGKAFGLTDRETAILQALARGLSNDEIAKELWVTQQTVKFHLTNIYRKLGAKNRTQATRIAQQHGLVDSPLFGDDEIGSRGERGEDDARGRSDPRAVDTVRGRADAPSMGRG